MLLSPRSTLDLNHITGWIFDLDNTIYPAESGLFPQVAERMTHYLEATFNLTRDDAFAMRRDLFERFGTTGRGLMEEHGMDPAEFLSFVHDIDLSEVVYDEELDSTLGNLPGKKVIFTNGTTEHARRILEAYRIDHHFEYCYDIIEADHRPKPEAAIYDDMLARTGIDASQAVMLEDMQVNLKPAHDRGITTIWLDHELDWAKSGMTAPHIDYIARDLKSFFRSLR
ncbi:MAG: pyrimidine 5'-nucleotidase [Alphaproteobacteria bacterium]|nr:pyrimidine 5'-nucleotidase [Alphaproteobacteria bacterium]